MAARMMILAAGAALVGADSAAQFTDRSASFPIVELRQYTLHDGQRDTLIELFEREFVESQEALGMKVIGTFRDLDRPNRFVWLRGFRDMDSRLAGLTSFYGGPVWRAHREAANATMIDSDNVFLLHGAGTGAEFKLPDSRPALGAQVPAGLVVAVIDYLDFPPREAVLQFETQVKPRLREAGIPLLAWFVPERSANNFPRLPVREHEQVLVWFVRLDSETDYAAHKSELAAAARPLSSFASRAPDVLRLKPTARSLIR
jgi:hypothetical protein